MSWKVYEYKQCGTCRNALKFLDKKGISYVRVPVRESPPKKTELQKMLKAYDGEIKKLFNRSSQDYRDLKLKDKLDQMSTEEAFELLQKNGNLVKRPFVISERGALLGFKEEEWEKYFA